MDLSEMAEIIAIRDVAKELFVRPQISFDILAFGNKNAARFQNNVRKAVDDVPLKFKIFENETLFFDKSISFNQSAIIFGVKNILSKFLRRARLSNEFPKDLRFLIFTRETTGTVPKNLPILTEANILHNKLRLYVYFLHSKTDTIDFFTFEWFTAKACNKRKKILINTFNKKTREWKKPFGEIERKFRNFHGCTIAAVKTFTNYVDKLGKVRGAIFEILDMIGSKANFTVYRQLSLMDIKGKRNFTVKNLRELQPQIISDIDFYNDTKYHVTTTFDDYKFTIIITKGERYVSYEKLLMPFDVITWSLLVFTFTIAFVVIFIINHMSKQLQNLFYGESINFPAFNVLGTFFGISQTHLPASNFPRMILMNFILFCLVIRTAYQGVFFELMAADMRKHVPTTIDGILDENYKIYTLKGHIGFDIFDKNFAKGRNIKYEFISKINCLIFEDIIERDAFITIEFWLKLFTFFCFKDYLLLDEPFLSLPVAMKIQPNHFMFHVINEVIDQSIPAGIPQYWYKFEDEFFIKKFYSYGHEELQSLNIDDWRFGFELWLGCLAISTIVFIIEILQWPNVRRKWAKKWKINDRQKKKMKIRKIQVKSLRDKDIWIEIGKSLDFDVCEIKI